LWKVNTARRTSILRADLNEKEFLAGVLRPFHEAIVKALAPHFHDVFEGEYPADDPELIHYAIDLIHDAGRPFGTFPLPILDHRKAPP
jgi:hypothetical protein